MGVNATKKPAMLRIKSRKGLLLWWNASLESPFFVHRALPWLGLPLLVGTLWVINLVLSALWWPNATLQGFLALIAIACLVTMVCLMQGFKRALIAYRDGLDQAYADALSSLFPHTAHALTTHRLVQKARILVPAYTDRAHVVGHALLLAARDHLECRRQPHQDAAAWNGTITVSLRPCGRGQVVFTSKLAYDWAPRTMQRTFQDLRVTQALQAQSHRLSRAQRKALRAGLLHERWEDDHPPYSAHQRLHVHKNLTAKIRP